MSTVNPERFKVVPEGLSLVSFALIGSFFGCLFAVFAYNLETCANNRHKCSAFADCRDYRDGYCCHCRSGFYGNGKDCVAEGEIPLRFSVS